MITVYATNRNGEGHIQEIGRYDDWEDIELRVGMFAPDVVITFELEKIKIED